MVFEAIFAINKAKIVEFGTKNSNFVTKLVVFVAKVVEFGNKDGGFVIKVVAFINKGLVIINNIKKNSLFTPLLLKALSGVYKGNCLCCCYAPLLYKKRSFHFTNNN